MNQHTTVVDVPLFPLRTVLFPGMTMALKIFEERYKMMIGECLEQDRAFGVVLIRRGVEVSGEAVPYAIGTLARIVDHETVDDGGFRLLTRGGRRFQIISMRPRAGFMTGRVELLDEEELDRNVIAERLASVSGRFARFLTEFASLTGAKLGELELPVDPTSCSYYIAMNMPLDAWEKQRLLEATSTDVRLLEERRIISRDLELLRRFGRATPPYPTGEDEDGHLRFSPN